MRPSLPRWSPASAAALLVLALAAAPAPATAQAAQYFLQLDSIPGDSNDARYPGAIVLLAYSVGGDAPRSSSAAIKVTKYLDRASPKLWLANQTGQHIKSATLTARRPPPSSFVFATLALQDVTVAGFLATFGQQAQTEAVTLQGVKATFCDRFQKADGSLGGSVCSCWDYAARASCGGPN